ncbi:type IV secretion system protein VirJ [Sphingobium amiense]|uniref:Type IV secretion system protein VirJ n=2 Tax=Sphingobium amiense TaxID=135719 RepID=A0A494W3H1_9SPHN|nr:virulence factor [Sphingobium amiense]BBD97147.1 type IV secretion system protein VirJ [Sphingobium amiense]
MAAVALLAALLLAAFAWLGYIGGSVFTAIVPGHYRPRPGEPVAILWSGDMGFRLGMGPMIADHLVKDGIPVIGVNSLAYFNVRRTPQEAEALLDRSIRQAWKINRQARLLLVGQSYGADMLQVALAGLPPATRKAVGQIILVVPGATVAFRASPTEIFTFAMHEEPALPTARGLGWAPTLCIGGREEASGLCRLLHQRGVRTVLLPGGHPLRRDDDAVYAVMRRAMASSGVAGGR